MLLREHEEGNAASFVESRIFKKTFELDEEHEAADTPAYRRLRLALASALLIVIAALLLVSLATIFRPPPGLRRS